jgi:hypothetical protein
MQGKDGAQLNNYTQAEIHLAMAEVTVRLERSGEKTTRQTAMLEEFVRRAWQDSQWDSARRQPSRN